jgi:hypothetical protein
MLIDHTCLPLYNRIESTDFTVKICRFHLVMNHDFISYHMSQIVNICNNSTIQFQRYILIL